MSSGPPPTKPVGFRAEPVQSTKTEEQINQDYARGVVVGYVRRDNETHSLFAAAKARAFAELRESEEWKAMCVSCAEWFDTKENEGPHWFDTWDALRKKVEGEG